MLNYFVLVDFSVNASTLPRKTKLHYEGQLLGTPISSRFSQYTFKCFPKVA